MDIRAKFVGLLAISLALASNVAVLKAEDSEVYRPDVVGGEAAERGDWPWQVALVIDGQHACGGTLIDPQWVLTAQHCVVDPFTGERIGERRMQVRVGAHERQGGELVPVAFARPYPQFNLADGDIALLRLQHSTAGMEGAEVVDLLEDPNDPALESGKTAVVTGWGVTDEGTLAEVLQQAELDLIACPPFGGDGIVCVAPGDEGRNACSGDSGGPLVVESEGVWYQAGIVSFGTGEICSDPQTIGVFTKVPSYSDWIAEVMADKRPVLAVEVDAPRVIAQRDEYEYELRLMNLGLSSAANIRLQNAVPDGVDFVSSQSNTLPEDGVLEWEIPELEPGEVFETRYRVLENPAEEAAVLELDATPALQDAAADVHFGRRALKPDIIGGDDVDEREYPWMVGLYSGFDEGNNQFCGGSLIADEWVLTAAHCVTEGDGSGIEVEVGSVRRGGGQRIQVEKVFGFGRFEVLGEGDVALLKLREPVTPSESVQAVEFISPDLDWLFSGNAEGVVMGWGLSDQTAGRSPNILQQLKLDILSDAECRNVETIDLAHELCAVPEDEGKSACFGDSGGPFVARRSQDDPWIQVGVVSRGTHQTCGAPGSTNIFARVPALRAWILDKMEYEQPDKIIVNDGSRLFSSDDFLEGSIGIAKTFVDWASNGPQPTAEPTPTPGATSTGPLLRMLYLPALQPQ